MEEQGVTRSELAERMGVARQRVTNFLNTPSNTTLLTIVRFAEALGLAVDVEIKMPGAAAVSADPGIIGVVGRASEKGAQPSGVTSEERGAASHDQSVAA